MVVESSIKFTVNVMGCVAMLDRQPYITQLSRSCIIFLVTLCIIAVLRVLCRD